MEQTPLTKQEVIKELADYLNTREIHYETIHKNSTQIYNRTTTIIKIVFFSIGVLLVINSYFIYDFAEGIISMHSSMNDMFQHFEKMAVKVDEITQSVEKMTTHIDTLPLMDKSIYSINHTVFNMNVNMQSIETEVGFMANDIGSMTQNFTKMTYDFEQVTNNMSHIKHDVNQMSLIIPF